MPIKRSGFSFDHPVVVTFLIFAVIGFMYLASEVLKPLAFAVLLSFALAPLAGLFQRVGLPRSLSVVLTVLLTLGILGGIGYKVGEQLTTLATHIDRDRLESNISHKFGSLKPTEANAFTKLSKLASGLLSKIDRPEQVKGAMPVNVVSQPSYTERLQAAVGPYLQGLGEGVFVLILVLFMLTNREDLSDRIIRMFGKGRMSVTTKSMDEVGQRISRYLMMFAVVNSTVGLIVGLGLWAIGVPLATLWGVLAALFRFIPYVGPATAFVLPLLYSVANFPGWREPLMVIGLFATIEILANSFFEPVIYGRTTGVNALGLLVAAMFWTWLWGALGLLLSTPMTVCLAVLGKYVPGLQVFAIMLGEDPPLEPDVRFYQRLLAMDPDGATQVVEAELGKHPRVEVFDQLLVPTLTRAERDYRREDIDDREHTFVVRFVVDLIEDIAATPEPAGVDSPKETEQASEPADAVRVVGVSSSDETEAIVLRMLAVLLDRDGIELTIEEQGLSPLKLADKLAAADPPLVVLSLLPPGGLTPARYLVRRLRAQFAKLPLLVGRWGEGGDLQATTDRLTEAGASDVVFRLADARERVLEQLRPKPETADFGLVASPAVPEPAAGSPG